MSAALASRIAADFAADTHAPHDLQRQRAMRLLSEQGLPTSRDENWKYVNLRPLEKVRFAPPASGSQPAVTAADLPAAVAGYARYTFIDGVFAPTLSSLSPPAGITVDSLRASATQPAESAVEPAGDLRFALLNEAFATDGAHVRVASGADCQTCVELVFVATTQANVSSSYPRVRFQVGTNARVGLIERHVSIGSDANFINCAVDVEVARDACVEHYRLQQTGARAIWFDTLTAKLAENAQYHLHSVNLGALSARSTTYVQMNGERSGVRLSGVSVGGKNQVHDTFALVDHIAPNARTEQNFRGISAGRARVAFNGKIIVRKGAHGTDSQQSLRGLLAGGDAEIDVRPPLEIYTDDVRCSHGATAGKLDDNMLFYLLSRGIERETAQRLLKWAFLEDVVARIEVPELRRQIERSLAGQLNESAILQDALYTAHGELDPQFARSAAERATPAK